MGGLTTIVNILGDKKWIKLHPQRVENRSVADHSQEGGFREAAFLYAFWRLAMTDTNDGIHAEVASFLLFLLSLHLEGVISYTSWTIKLVRVVLLRKMEEVPWAAAALTVVNALPLVHHRGFQRG